MARVSGDTSAADWHKASTRSVPAIVWLLTAALAMAGCSPRQALIANNETGAIGSVRMVLSAQFTHAALCDGSFAPTLPVLVEKGHIGADFGAVDQPTRLGYRFRMTAVKGDSLSECGDFYKDFEIRAEPEVPGETGVRYFRAGSDGDVLAATRPDFSDAAILQ